MTAAACTASSHDPGPKATVSLPDAVGTWQITYGAPATVTITADGSGALVMTASSPVTVVGSTCQLATGTMLATLTGTTSPYTGQHGLWWTTNCAFARWTSLTLRVTGDTAQAQLGDGESLTLKRQASPATAPSTAATHSVAPWFWLLIIAALLIALAGVLVARRRRRQNAE